MSVLIIFGSKCALASHVKYAPCALLRLEKSVACSIEVRKGWDRRADRCQTVTLCLLLDAVSVMDYLINEDLTPDDCQPTWAVSPLDGYHPHPPLQFVIITQS